MSFNQPGERKPEEYALARKLKAEGVPIGIIAKRVGVGTTAVSNWTKDIPDTSRHTLSNIDEVAKTAFCSKCQELVGVKKSSRWYCVNSKKYKKRNVPKQPCAICGNTVKLVWDHCHSSGNFRGWLCHSCNVGLGFFKDNPDTLQKAMDYLNKS